LELRYIGRHKPKGMIINVEDSEVKHLLNSGDYERITFIKPVELVEEEEEIVTPDKTWTEMEIYDWIQNNNIPVGYKPASDTKKFILKELIKGGYI